jgi:LAS superfamily LD-carboxypeptidase LdcB
MLGTGCDAAVDPPSKIEAAPVLASAPTEAAQRESAPKQSEAAREQPEPEPEAYEPRVPQLDCELIKEHGYRKGKRFPIKVVTIDGRMVERRTADAYMAMHKAAGQDGVELPIYSGFRTQAEQKYFYRCYKTCSCNSCIRAARPGHSNHQSGRALDIGQWEGTHEWLVEHAREFGFRATIRSEPWHWEYRGGRRTRWPPACPDLGT